MTAQETQSNVEKALEEIRPFLLSDGGDISLVNIKNNIVRVQLEGACTSCSVNQMTLTNGVDRPFSLLRSSRIPTPSGATARDSRRGPGAR